MPERRLRPGVRRAGLVAGLVALVALVAYGTTFSWLFAADEVRVEGAERIGAEEVRRLGKLAVGDNVFHLDTAAAEARVERDPRIADAVVEADLPDLIVVRVVERVPVAVADVAGSPATVADDGAVLPGPPPQGLPRIEAVAGELGEARRVAAAQALAAMTPALRRSIAIVYTDADDELVIETGDGVTVTYGAVLEVGAKADALRAVLSWADGEGIDLVAIDITVPSAPTARTADGTFTPR